MAPLATIFGLSGPELSADEAAFFRDAGPWAFILFARNVDTPDQLRRLCADLRGAVSRDALIFVDQEGGRVQRLRDPHWQHYPSASVYGGLYQHDPASARRAAFLAYRLIADDLKAVGINADCAPVLDIPQPDADPIISDRAFGTQSEQIVDLANAAMAGLMRGGVAPVIKHMPGHGRATVDSHLSLPRIDTDLDSLDQTDFEPFRRLGPAPMAMTAHVVLSSVDDKPVTLSRPAIQTVIREQIGYDGLLMTDDLDMKALQHNSHSAKATAALDAGCDVVLQCSGQLRDMMAIAEGARSLSAKALERAQIAELTTQSPDAFDRDAAQAEFDQLAAQFS